MATRKNKPKTAGYKPIDLRWMRQPRDLAVMTFEDVLWMMREPTICLGLEMRAAPLSGAEYEVESDSETVKAYVTAQLDTIWDQLSALDTAQAWGWSACEVMTKQTLAGTLEITELLSRHANDTRAITVDGQVRAVRFNRIEGAPTGHVDLPVGDVHSTLGPPKAIFHAHDPQAGAVYGTSILEGAFSPWCDKWHKGGALDVRRLAMIQNSITGRKMWYPDGSMEIPGHATPVPNRDTARMIIEQMMAGAVPTLPSDMDEKGNQRWQLEEATALAGLEFILQYPKDLDIEILRGMKIPDDVIMSQADSSGAWAGKQVPQAAFYTGLTRWLTRMLADIRRCILDYLVWFNFGLGHWYKIIPKPLAEQAMEAQKKPGDSQNAGPQPQYPPHESNGNGRMPPMPQRMGLDPVEAVGRGVLDAGDLVEAARRVMRLSTDKVGHEHGEKGSGKGGQFVAKGGAGARSEKGKKGEKAVAAEAEPASKLTQQARGIVRKIKPSKQRAFSGEPTGGKISKQLAGAIGEEIIIQWLKSQGQDDAGQLSGFLGTDKNNLPVDLIYDHRVVEVKTGQASNSSSAQQWRLTIGEPGEKEKAWLATATPEKKAAWNAKKQAMIHKRKKAEIAKLSKHLGYNVQGNTMTVIINPDTKTADIYAFDGFHDRIAWKSEHAAKGYLGSVKYG